MVSICTDIVIHLLNLLAVLAVQASPDLSTTTSSIALFECGDLGTHSQDFSNNLVTNGNGCWGVTPAASDGVNIRTADTATFDLDVDIVVAECLELELYTLSVPAHCLGNWLTYRLLLEIFIFSKLIDHEAFSFLWVRHRGSICVDLVIVLFEVKCNKMLNVLLV